MTKIIEYLGNFFQWIGNFFTSIFNTISSIIKVLGKCLDYVKDVLNILPGWIYAVIIVLVVVCVLYKILGREGNA